MYALAHHQSTLQSTESAPVTITKHCITTFHGPTCLVEGDKWNKMEDLSTLQFFLANCPPQAASIPALASTVSADLHLHLHYQLYCWFGSERGNGVASLLSVSPNNILSLRDGYRLRCPWCWRRPMDGTHVTYPSIDEDVKAPATSNDPSTDQQELLDVARARWESMDLDNDAFHFRHIHGLALFGFWKYNGLGASKQGGTSKLNLEDENATVQRGSSRSCPNSKRGGTFPRYSNGAVMSADPLSSTVRYREHGIPIQVQT